MKLLKLLLLGFVFSCFPSDEEMERQVTSRFEGSWIGTYEGDDHGNITFKVTNKGNLNGIITSNQPPSPEEILGYIQSDGKLSANTRSGFIFSGQITNFENSKGNWMKKSQNGILKGSFNIRKE